MNDDTWNGGSTAGWSPQSCGGPPGRSEQGQRSGRNAWQTLRAVVRFLFALWPEPLKTRVGRHINRPGRGPMGPSRAPRSRVPSLRTKFFHCCRQMKDLDSQMADSLTQLLHLQRHLVRRRLTRGMSRGWRSTRGICPAAETQAGNTLHSVPGFWVQPVVGRRGCFKRNQSNTVLHRLARHFSHFGRRQTFLLGGA